jgi:sec-independent protein translocase protein TatC
LVFQSVLRSVSSLPSRSFISWKNPSNDNCARRACSDQIKSGTVDLDQIKEGEVVDYTFTQETAIGGARVPTGTTVPVKATKIDGKLTLVLQRRWAVGSAIVAENKPIATIVKEGEDLESSAPAPVGWKAWLASLYSGGSDAGGMSEEDRLIMRSVTGAFTLYVAGRALHRHRFGHSIFALSSLGFISPGLYHHEKKYITPVLTMAAVFFAMGAAFAYKIAFSGGLRLSIEMAD